MTDFTPEYYLKTWRKTVEEGVREDGLIHDVADDIHEYFTSAKMRDWCEIGDDARRIYNMMFADSPDEEVQDESPDRKSTRLNSSHIPLSRMPSSA